MLDRPTNVIVSLAVAAVVLMATACGQTATRSSIGADRSSRPIGASGGTPDQEAVLKPIVAGMGSGAPTVTIENQHGGGDLPTGTWLSFGVPEALDVSRVKPEWMSFMIAGIFRNLSNVKALPKVVGTFMSGSIHVLSDNYPPVTLIQPNPDEIEANLARIGLTKVSIDFLHPDAGVTPVVVVQTPDPKAFVGSHPDPQSDVFGDIRKYEGTYLEIDDAQGQPVWLLSYASRASAGIGWIRPGLGGGSVTSGSPFGSG